MCALSRLPLAALPGIQGVDAGGRIFLVSLLRIPM